jgi:hypothetical protein
VTILRDANAEARMSDEQHRRKRRRQLIAVFVEQQRKARQFVNLADLVDWCARSTTAAGVDEEERARELAYRRLAHSILMGEFEQGRPHVRYLDPEVSRWRLKREQIKIALEAAAALGSFAASEKFWGFCWLPGELARQWLRSQGYRLPPHFEPVPKTAAKKPPTARKEGRFWMPARGEAMKWLEEEGCPAQGDGNQARLERHIADSLSSHGHDTSESSIRRHVARWIAERRSELLGDAH